MPKCTFRETREAYLKCDLEKVRQVADRLQRFLHAGCHEENVCAGRRPLHSHTQALDNSTLLPSLCQAHIPFIPGQSPWFTEFPDNFLLEDFLLITSAWSFMRWLCPSFMHSRLHPSTTNMQSFRAGYTQAPMFYINCINKSLPRIQWELGKDALCPGSEAQDNCQGQLLVLCLQYPSLSADNRPLSCSE